VPRVSFPAPFPQAPLWAPPGLPLSAPRRAGGPAGPLPASLRSLRRPPALLQPAVHRAGRHRLGWGVADVSGQHQHVSSLAPGPGDRRLPACQRRNARRVELRCLRSPWLRRQQAWGSTCSRWRAGAGGASRCLQKHEKCSTENQFDASEGIGRRFMKIVF